MYGRDAEYHAINVIKLLQRCRQHQIRLNESKIRFSESQIEFAGLIMTKSGFSIDPKFNQAITDFPVPTMLTDVRSFHGLINQLLAYDPLLAQKMEPLRHLLTV